MSIPLYPMPPHALLPTSTTVSMAWQPQDSDTPTLAVARWLAAHTDAEGWLTTDGPARPSRTAFVHIGQGPLTFLVPQHEMPHGRWMAPGMVRVFPALRHPDGRLRPFLWPLSWSSRHTRLADIHHSFVLDNASLLADFLANAPVPARTAQEAHAGAPVMPWLVDDLTQGPGAVRLADNHTIPSIARAAWIWAKGAPTATPLLRVHSRTYHTKGAWSWDARLAAPGLQLDTGWTSTNDSPVARMLRAATAAAKHLMQLPELTGDPAGWYSQKPLLLYNSRLSWADRTGHMRLTEAKCIALLRDFQPPQT